MTVNDRHRSMRNTSSRCRLADNGHFYFFIFFGGQVRHNRRLFAGRINALQHRLHEHPSIQLLTESPWRTLRYNMTREVPSWASNRCHMRTPCSRPSFWHMRRMSISRQCSSSSKGRRQSRQGWRSWEATRELWSRLGRLPALHCTLGWSSGRRT